MKITEQLIKNSVSSTTYQKGLEYFREGRVHLRKRDENLISAVVDGKHLYNVSIKFDNDTIKDAMCTCPYFETMHTNCKHIVAVLKQRQTELLDAAASSDTNDSLAQSLCKSFATKVENKNFIHFKFHLYINQPTPDTTYFSMSLQSDKDNSAISGVENFLEHYTKKLPYQIDKTTFYTPNTTEFVSPQKEILDILAETYENRMSSDNFRSKAVYQTSFGEASAIRILKLLKTTSFSIIYNGINIPDVRICEGNPDIIIDVYAVEEGVCLSVNDRGYALEKEGYYFLYNNTIYETTKEWREYFMPIYTALVKENRTQITFKNQNILPFATHILPFIRGKQGVITQNIDNIIIDEKPDFEIYFDKREAQITAVVIAKYGNITHRLPLENNENMEKIVLRDIKSETNILSFFSDFSYKNGTFYVDDDEIIYNFIKYSLLDLEKKATIIYSLPFENIFSKNVHTNINIGFNEQTELLETDFDTNLTEDELFGILTAIKLRKNFYRLHNRNFVILDGKESSAPFALLHQLEFSKEDIVLGKKNLLTSHALFLDSLEFIKKDDSFLRYIKKIKSVKANIPKGLKNVLRNYQKIGMDWFKQLSLLGFGGILADDMGLGKTLQSLAYISGENPTLPVLIVTPSALTYNWYNEIKKFTPTLCAKIIDGTKENRKKAIAKITSSDIIITSYPLLRRDIALYSSVEFSYCFIDEAQYIKNPKTKNAICVKKVVAQRRFALTGTPIENSLSELWSIFDFIMPDYLGTLSEFRMEFMQDTDTSVNNTSLETLRSKIKPFILRRLKSEVLEELPEKIENNIFAELNTEQQKLYSAFVSLAKRKTINLLSNGKVNKIQILSLLTRLRQICCHPALFDENYLGGSGKFELLSEVLEQALSGGHRVLIFSQYTSMLSLIREYLEKKHIKSFYLDGKTPSYERLEMADRFNYGERDVFLISLKAGGAGLNLTGADTVIHYDPWWNPATMDQASDRAHRIGQNKAVQIIKLITKGTIEEKILVLQESKRSLANDIIQINKDTLSSLSKEEILSLFD